MSRHLITFVVPAEITVVVEGDNDEDLAYEIGCDLVTEHLATLEVPDSRGVSVAISIDGVGGEVKEL